MNNEMDMLKGVFRICKIQDRGAKIEFISNIHERSLELAGSREVEREILEVNDDNLRGRTMTPDRDGDFHVLISTKSENYLNGMWQSTLAHELTHVDDLSKAKEFSRVMHYYEMINCDWYFAFHSWSEVHATKNGLCYLQALNNDVEFELLDEKIKEDYYQKISDEFKIRCKITLNCLADKDSVKHSVKHIYRLSDIAGRVLAYNDLTGQIYDEFYSLLNIKEREFIEFLIEKCKDEMSFELFTKFMVQLGDKINALDSDLS